MNDKDGQDMTPHLPSSSEVSLGVRIDRICEEFEKRLKAGESPTIESYLPQLPSSEHATLLEELLGLELDYRAKAGDSFTSEEYILRFPEHASKVAKLVVNVRQQKSSEPQNSKAKPADDSPVGTRPTSDSSASTQKRSRSEGPVRIGPYEIVEACGRGGMGVVYKAWHDLFHQYRAIKVLPSHFDEDDINRFAMEIKIAGQLHHHNIVRAYEANREHDILYLAMEFVDGINLDHLVKHHERLPVGLACDLIRQAAEGMQHAHDHDLVHRDIKPSNLMINQNGQIKILDFGLARLQADQNASRLTKHGSVMGTLDYMAPEQWEDPMGATIQSDIYSLGCTFYYLITGAPPYSGNQYSHWLKKQEAHRMMPVPKLEGEQFRALQPIVERMMAKSVEDRYEFPAQVAEALAPLSEVSELKTYAKTPVPQLADSEVVHKPVPTAYVSSTDVLGQETREALEEQFGLDDSEVNSNAKTLRPNRSHTDIDSDQRTTTLLPPPRQPWHKSRIAWLSLVVLAVFLLSGVWYFFRPPSNPEFAEQLGALPGLNGGLNADWWFAEMPWYGPGIRQELMKAIRNGETEIAGVSLDNLKDQLTQADTQTLHEDLRTIADELKTRLPAADRDLAEEFLLHDPDTPNYEKNLLNVLPDAFRSEEKLPASLLKEATASQLHWLANLLHHASSSENSQFAPKAEQLYNAAIKAYDEDDDIERTLEALANSDYSRFLAGRGEFSTAIIKAKRAADAVPNAGLFQISLRCELVDQYRKMEGNSTNALAQLTGDSNSAKSWADEMGLAAQHPLQAEMLERRAWINLDGWHMEQALSDFEKATEIREANRQQGNQFAWRPVLMNMQGQAMALHFLGRDQDYVDQNGHQKPGAIKIYHELVNIITGSHSDSFGTEAERKSRLPNVHERHGDVYLFDYSDTVDYGKAEEQFAKATVQADFYQGFNDSATHWVYLMRLYYKHALAQILQGDLQAAMATQEKADKLEARFREQMDPEAFENQTRVFAQEKKVALVLKTLIQAEGSGEEATPEQIQKALEELQKLVKRTDNSNLHRSNIEVFLLVVHELFQRHNTLNPADIRALSNKLLSVIEPVRGGDIAITRKYLATVLKAAYKAVDSLQDDDEAQDLKTQLNEALGGITPVTKG